MAKAAVKPRHRDRLVLRTDISTPQSGKSKRSVTKNVYVPTSSQIYSSHFEFCEVRPRRQCDEPFAQATDMLPNRRRQTRAGTWRWARRRSSVLRDPSSCRRGLFADVAGGRFATPLRMAGRLDHRAAQHVAASAFRHRDHGAFRLADMRVERGLLWIVRRWRGALRLSPATRCKCPQGVASAPAAASWARRRPTTMRNTRSCTPNATILAPTATTET